MQQDRFVEFCSELGNSFVAPSAWKAEDKGDSYTLRSPDGHAVIQVMTFTVEGSGTIDEFREMVVGSLLPKDAGSWQESLWTNLKIGDGDALCRRLTPAKNAEHEWRVYIVQKGSLYHAIILNATTLAMELNGEFYESIVLTFQGVHR